jgi:L-aspartate oxidase
MNTYDYVIVGSGIAGLYTALLAKQHGSVLTITKGSIEECNTRYAQGGIAAAIGANDSPELHFQDTIAAGAGLCDEEAVRILVTEAPDRIIELVGLGVPFDTLEGAIALGREGAHSVSRILHAGGDSTGEHIENTLSGRARATDIRVREYSLVTEIIVENRTVKGVRVMDAKTETIEELGCKHLILATGGTGRLFKFNTNPDVATGDGIALAYRAGADVSDMEFVQFHPTALRLPGIVPFLISEAVRGEGGILRNKEGRAFMQDYSAQGDLAPRDVVSRSILDELAKTGSDAAFLDVTHLPARTVTTRFPNIYRVCLQQGIDITKEWIPVAPAAHYMIGGVKTDHWGAASLSGLFACGEAACTGVHGANRLASNSLLDALVFGRRIVTQTVRPRVASASFDSTADDYTYRKIAKRQGGQPTAGPSVAALQELMWEKVGIVRDGKGLTEAAETLAAWERALPSPVDRPSHELSNMIMVSRLMAEAALIREESRGAHYRLDSPHASSKWQKHIVLMR